MTLTADMERPAAADLSADRLFFSAGIAVSLLLHVFAALAFLDRVEPHAAPPVPEAVEVELVPPPESEAEEPVLQLEELPEPDPEDQEQPAPEEPETPDPAPAETEEPADTQEEDTPADQAEPEELPEDVPEEVSEEVSEEAAETAPEPEPAPPPAEEEATAAEEQPADPPAVVAPVFEFGDEDTAPETPNEPTEDTAPDAVEEETSSAEEGDVPDAAAAAETAEDAGEGTGTGDVGDTGEGAEGDTGEDTGEGAGAETGAEDAPPADTDAADGTEEGTAEEPSEEAPEETLETEDEGLPADYGVVGKIETAQTPAAKPARRSGGRGPGEGGSGSSESSGRSGASGNLPPAQRLYTNTLNIDPRRRTAMDGMPPGERMNLLCMTELRAQLNNQFPPIQPDLMPSLRPRGGTVLDPGGWVAFRAFGDWFNVAFRCEVDDSVRRVVNFSYRVGNVIPPSEWRARGLPAN